MDALTLILIFLIFFAAFLFITANKKKNIKAPAIKKEELIQSYKNQMKELLLRYENDKQLQTKEKIKLLKHINQELSMNLFFEKEEATKLLKELSTLS
jgi:flagellar biosynthesis protein FliP